MIAPTPAPETITAKRKALSLTQEQAAALLGMSRRAWAGWETGERDMPRPLWTLIVTPTTERE